MNEAKKSLISQYIFIHLITVGISEPARNPLRVTHNIPTIIVKNEKESTTLIQKDSHIEYYPFFETYDPIYLEKNKLKNEYVEHRFQKNIFFSTKTLKKDLENLIDEVKKGKKKYRSFDIIQKKNFNFKLTCGLLVLKHKQMPFVIKLFAENPATLVNPTSKGFDPTFFFYMAGGANRHFAGFTRIKNKHYVEQWSKKNPYWKNKIILPRKWYWEPENPEYIMIEGKNLQSCNKKTSIKIPGIYAIIADYFPFKTAREYNSIKHKTIMQLCKDIKFYIDPHENNYFLIKNNITGQMNIALIDTEHFPTMVGIDPENPPSVETYFDWLLYLSKKCLQDMYFHSKKTRNARCEKKYFLNM